MPKTKEQTEPRTEPVNMMLTKTEKAMYNRQRKQAGGMSYRQYLVHMLLGREPIERG